MAGAPPAGAHCPPVQPGTRFLVVDCRYPFEYEGGHIKVGAAACWARVVFRPGPAGANFPDPFPYTHIHSYARATPGCRQHLDARPHAPRVSAGRREPRTPGPRLPCPRFPCRPPALPLIWHRRRTMAAARRLFSTASFRRSARRPCSDRPSSLFTFADASVAEPTLPPGRRIEMLRNLDRNLHDRVYPRLFYPECYLLLGGYKAFHARFPVGMPCWRLSRGGPGLRFTRRPRPAPLHGRVPADGPRRLYRRPEARAPALSAQVHGDGFCYALSMSPGSRGRWHAARAAGRAAAPQSRSCSAVCSTCAPSATSVRCKAPRTSAREGRGPLL